MRGEASGNDISMSFHKFEKKNRNFTFELADITGGGWLGG
jgi:hypothetical protein